MIKLNCENTRHALSKMSSRIEHSEKLVDQIFEKETLALKLFKKTTNTFLFGFISLAVGLIGYLYFDYSRFDALKKELKEHTSEEKQKIEIFVRDAKEKINSHIVNRVPVSGFIENLERMKHGKMTGFSHIDFNQKQGLNIYTLVLNIPFRLGIINRGNELVTARFIAYEIAINGPIVDSLSKLSKDSESFKMRMTDPSYGHISGGGISVSSLTSASHNINWTFNSANCRKVEAVYNEITTGSVVGKIQIRPIFEVMERDSSFFDFELIIKSDSIFGCDDFLPQKTNNNDSFNSERESIQLLDNN